MQSRLSSGNAFFLALKKLNKHEQTISYGLSKKPSASPTDHLLGSFFVTLPCVSGSRYATEMHITCTITIKTTEEERKIRRIERYYIYSKAQ